MLLQEFAFFFFLIASVLSKVVPREANLLECRADDSFLSDLLAFADEGDKLDKREFSLFPGFFSKSWNDTSDEARVRTFNLTVRYEGCGGVNRSTKVGTYIYFDGKSKEDATAGDILEDLSTIKEAPGGRYRARVAMVNHTLYHTEKLLNESNDLLDHGPICKNQASELIHDEPRRKILSLTEASAELIIVNLFSTFAAAIAGAIAWLLLGGMEYIQYSNGTSTGIPNPNWDQSRPALSATLVTFISTMFSSMYGFRRDAVREFLVHPVGDCIGRALTWAEMYPIHMLLAFTRHLFNRVASIFGPDFQRMGPEVDGDGGGGIQAIEGGAVGERGQGGQGDIEIGNMASVFTSSTTSSISSSTTASSSSNSVIAASASSTGTLCDGRPSCRHGA